MFRKKEKFNRATWIAGLFLLVVIFTGCDNQQIKTVTETPALPKQSSESQGQSKNLYKVIKVVDGDTLDVDIDGKTERLRLIGIDTPETVDPRKPVQCFGREASDKAKEILNGKMISLEIDTTQGERDKYGRLLRFVYLEDGTFFNKLMIAEGYAHEYTYQSNPCKYQTEFKEAENQARVAKKGLWDPEVCPTSPVCGDRICDKSEECVCNEDCDSVVICDPALPRVKKSVNNICHEIGSTYYEKTINYTPYDTMGECLKSGGRLPKR